jgi:hypothetical protein
MTAPDPITTPDATPVLLDPDQADDLRRHQSRLEDQRSVRGGAG